MSYGFSTGAKTKSVIADFVLTAPKPGGVNVSFFTATQETLHYFSNKLDNQGDKCEADAVVSFNRQSAFVTMAMLADFLVSQDQIKDIATNDPEKRIPKLMKTLLEDLEKRYAEGE